MKWRTAWLIIGALAILCLALIFSVVYPFSTTDLEERPSAASKFDAGDPLVYDFSITHTSDDGEYAEYTGVATASGEEYVAIVGENSRVELFRANRTAPLYTMREHTDSTDFDRLRERAVEDPQVTILSESRADDRYTLVTRSNTSSDERAQPLYPPGISGRLLETIAYHRVGETDDETITYEPRNGWYEDHREPYRITDASGTVTIDEDSNTIVAADVPWTRTAPAELYADYVLGTVADTDLERDTYSYTYETTDVDFDTPDWVERARE